MVIMSQIFGLRSNRDGLRYRDKFLSLAWERIYVKAPSTCLLLRSCHRMRAAQTINALTMFTNQARRQG